MNHVDNLILYVDGDEVDREETSADPELDNTKPLAIGKNSLRDNKYFNGKIDEVRIYNRALSQKEIQADMKVTKPVVPSTPKNELPGGWLDVANCESIRGWVRDPDTTSPIRVHIYADGPVKVGKIIGNIIANLQRPELPFADKNHRFNFSTPLSLKDGRSHKIYVYAIDSAGGKNSLLKGSPKSIRCGVPTPTLYQDAFRLSTGVVIFGELLNFDGYTFKIKTGKGVIEKRREEITTILLGVAQ